MSDATATSTPPAGRKPRSRQQFELKRERILEVATDFINERGIKGMTLQEVARAMSLNSTSVTYYFHRKELLAAAVFERTLQRIEAMVNDAATASTPEAKVNRLLALNVELRARVLRGEAHSLASLSDMRTLEDSVRIPLEKHFQAIFRQVRDFFGHPRSDAHKALLTARTHMLFEVIFWLPFWIGYFPLVDFPRVRRRLFDLLSNGLFKPGTPWAPQILEQVDEDGRNNAEGSENLLRAATKLINEKGYRGTSVIGIVEALQVTKGSFYHHLDAKDDLVLECFRRSYRRVSRVQSLAALAGGDCAQQLSSAVATLLDIQFEAEWPLMRTTALRTLPAPMRENVMERSNRLALRYSGTLVDGINEGSLRPVDPIIASQLIMATVNTAYDLRKWASGLPREQAIALYGSTLVDGIFNDRVIEGAAPAAVDDPAPAKGGQAQSAA